MLVDNKRKRYACGGGGGCGGKKGKGNKSGRMSKTPKVSKTTVRNVYKKTTKKR